MVLEIPMWVIGIKLPAKDQEEDEQCRYKMSYSKP